MDTYNLFIDGNFVAPTRGDHFNSINPYTGEAWAQVADGCEADMAIAVASARKAFDSGKWSGLTALERGKYLKKIAKAIRSNAKVLARIECQDSGKTIRHATYIDVPTCAGTFENFSKVRALLKNRKNAVNAPVQSVTAYEPIGVVAAIIPWNYPLIMFGWKVAPALAAGNTVVFKPSSQTSVSVLKLAQIIQQILPDGVLNIVPSTRHEVTAALVRSKDVDMVTFTGGTQTGREIMRMAAQTPKKVSLELGGKSPNIVFADCDFEAAIGGAMSAIFLNQGQMCTAGSRLLLESSIYDRFLSELVKRAKALKLGDPVEPETEFGPLVSAQHREKVLEAITRAIAEGANLACGGKVPEGEKLQNGFFLEPTIFAQVQNEMCIAQEEIFGPVLSVIKFSTVEEAVRIANDSDYGLAACVWTKDKEKAGLVSRHLRCGTVWINTYGGFYDQAPFGGCKLSGIGRELGVEGLMEYVQPKHLCRDTTPGGHALVTRWFSPMDLKTIFAFMMTNLISGIKKIFYR